MWGIDFELTGMTYDSIRKTHTMQKLRKEQADATVLNYAWNSVPYDLTFDLNIITRFTSDGLSLVEQILPYFTPSFTLKLRLVDSLDLITDVPVVLEGISNDHTYEFGQDPENKVLLWNLNFRVKTEYVGFISSQGIVTKAIVHTYASNTADTIYLQEDPQSATLEYADQRYTVTPDPSSSTANSDYGYSETWVHKTEP